MASSLNMPQLNHSSEKFQTMVFHNAGTLATMVEFRDRLRAAMDGAKVSRDALSAHLRVTRVAIDKLLDGRSKSMTAENCAKAARFLRADHFWLATGIGEMHPGEDDPQHKVADRCIDYLPAESAQWPMQTVTLAEYRTLSERQQGHIEGQIRNMLDVKKATAGAGRPRAGTVIDFARARSKRRPRPSLLDLNPHHRV